MIASRTQRRREGISFLNEEDEPLAFTVESRISWSVSGEVLRWSLSPAERRGLPAVCLPRHNLGALAAVISGTCSANMGVYYEPGAVGSSTMGRCLQCIRYKHV